MLVPFIAFFVSLVILVWSADKFVEGAASVAHHFGMSTLLVGMVIIGFGTSAPEIIVSAIVSFEGNSGIALGNAYGSNIANIALILGITAIMSPILIHPQAMRKEIPILLGITALSAWLLRDGSVDRTEAGILLLVFTIIMTWTIVSGLRNKEEIQEDDSALIISSGAETKAVNIKKSFFWLITGLIILVISSRILVWGVVEIATAFGISDLIIGLTVVALGTSLPELASSIAAARKGEHDMALGNVLGSNLFNTLAVVGIAGLIRPMTVGSEILSRDILAVAVLTLLLFLFGFISRNKTPCITRPEGFILLLCYVGYTGYLVHSVLTTNIM